MNRAERLAAMEYARHELELYGLVLPRPLRIGIEALIAEVVDQGERIAALERSIYGKEQQR